MPDIKELERFVQGGGDVSSIPDDVWTSAGLAPELKQKIVVFQRGKGDTASITLQPSAQPAPKPAAAPETSIKDQLIQSFHAGADRYIQNTRNMATAPQPAYDDPSLANLLSDPNLIDKMGKGFINFEGRTPVLGPGLSPFKTWAIRRFNELMGLGMQAIAPPMAVAQTAAEDISGALTGQGPGLVPVEQQVEPGTGLVPRLGHVTAQAVGLPFTVGGTAAQGAAALGADQDTQQLVGYVAPLLLTGAGGGALEAVPGAGKFGAMVEKGSNKIISKAESLAQKLPGNRPSKPVYIPPIEIEGFGTSAPGAPLARYTASGVVERSTPEFVETGKGLTQTARTKPAATETRGFDKADQPTTKKGKPIQGFENSDGSKPFVLKLQEDGSYAVEAPAPVEASINASSPNSVPTIPPIKIAAPEDFQVSEPGGTKQLGKRKKGGKVKPTARFNEAEPVSTSGAEAATGGNKPVPTIQPTGSTVALPPEIQAVVDGNAPAWFLPHEAEGTIPTKGEAFVRSLDKPTPPVEPRVRIRGPRTGAADASIGARSKVINIDPTGTSTISPALGAALGPKVRILETREGTIVFNPEIVTAEQIKTLESEGRVADVVNGPRTSPKPEKPTLAVVARDAEGTEVRTILADNEAKAKAAVEYQQAQGLKTEVVPADSPQAVGVLRERLTVPLKAKSQVLSRSRYVDSLGAEEGSKGIFKPRKREGPKFERAPGSGFGGNAYSRTPDGRYEIRLSAPRGGSDGMKVTYILDNKTGKVHTLGDRVPDYASTINDASSRLIDPRTEWTDAPDYYNTPAQRNPSTAPKPPIDPNKATSGDLASAVLRSLQEKDSFYSDSDTLTTLREKARSEGKSAAQIILETAKNEALDDPNVKLLEETIDAETQSVDRPVGNVVKELDLQDNRQNNSGVIGGARAETGMSEREVKTRGTKGGRKTKEVEAKAEARRQLVLDTIRSEYANVPDVVKAIDALKAKAEGSKVVGRKMQPVILQQAWAKLKAAIPDLTLEDVAHALTGVRRSTQVAEKITGEKPSARFASRSMRKQKGTISFGGGNLTDGAAALIGDIITKGTEAYKATSKWVEEQADTIFRTSDGGATKARDVMDDLSVLRDTQGKPKKWFHGSKSAPFEELDPSKLGENTGARSAKRAFFFTEDPANAMSSFYVGHRIEKDMGAIFGEPDAHVRVSYVRAENPFFYDMRGKDYSAAQVDGGLGRIIERASKAGHDAVIFQNFLDPGPRPVDVLALIKPENEITASPYPLGGKAVEINDLRADLHDVNPVRPRIKLNTDGVAPLEPELGPRRRDVVKALQNAGLPLDESKWPEPFRAGMLEADRNVADANAAVKRIEDRIPHGKMLESSSLLAAYDRLDKAENARLSLWESNALRYIRHVERSKPTLSSLSSGGSVTLGSGLGALQPLLEKGSKAASKLGSDIFDSAITELSKVNTEGKILAQKMAQVIHESARDYHRNVIPLDEAWKALSAEDKAAINAMPRQSRQDYRGMSPAAQAYGAAWHDTVNRLENERYKVYNFIQGRGGPRRSHIPAKDFQPVHFDPAIVEKMRNNDPQLLAEFQKLNPGVKTNPFAPVHNPKTGAVYDIARRTLESHELARQFKYPESWLTKNVHESHRLWIEDLTKSNAEHRNYRYNNPDGTPRNAGIGDKADFYHSVPLNERQAWERTIDTIEGHGYKHLTEKQRKLDKVVRGVNLYTTIAKIGGNIVSGLKQPTSLLNISTVTDFPTLAKGLVDMMLSPVEARRKAVANGAAPFANEFPEYFGSSLGDQTGHIAKTASRLSTAFTGFMDGLTRSVAHEAAPHAMKLLQERIREGGKAKEATLRLLDDMLFKPEEIAEISSGKVSPATELKFKNSFVSYTQQSARMAERPRWTHEGYGKMIAHLRQFGLGQTRFHIQNVVKEAKTHGNYGPLRRAVIGAFVAGELVREAVSPFKADDEERKDWSKMKSADEVIYRTTQDMSDAALLGLLGDAGTKTIHGIITGKIPYKGDPVSNNVVPGILDSFSNYYVAAVKTANNPKLKHILSLLDNEFAAKRQFSELQKSGKNVDFKAVNDFFFAKPPKSQKPVLNLKPR